MFEYKYILRYFSTGGWCATVLKPDVPKPAVNKKQLYKGLSKQTFRRR